MAFQNAQASRASIGLLNASGYTTAFSVNNGTEALDVTTIANTAKVFIIGQTMGDASFNMILDTLPATNSQYAVLNSWKSTQPTIIDFAPEGYDTGDPVVMMYALQTNATTSAAVAGVVEATVAAQASNEVDVGISVEDYTLIATTTTGTARDSGIAGGTTNGGVAHLHVTSFAGITNDIITIEHSVDGSTAWATLVTFATVTGLTSERVLVAAGTTVRRYLRVVDTVSGAGAGATRQVSFARR